MYGATKLIVALAPKMRFYLIIAIIAFLPHRVNLNTICFVQYQKFHFCFLLFSFIFRLTPK